MTRQTSFLAVCGLAAVCSVLTPRLVFAQVAEAATPAAPSPKVHLSWVRDAAAEACPDATQVQADVVARLGFSPFVAGDAPSAAIEVLVTRDRAMWQASVVMRGEDGALRGNRHVESGAPECRSLAAAAALAIALMIDPELLLRTPVAPKPPQSAEKSEPSSPPTDPARAVSATASSPSRPHGAVAVGIVGGAGLLPKAALGPVLRAELELGRHLAFALGAQFFSEQRRSQAGAEALFGLSLASLGPCYRAQLNERWALASCASLLLGSFGVSVASPEPVNGGARAWLAAACGLRLSFRTGALELSLSGEALAHFARRNYTVECQGPTRTESLFAEPAAGALVTLTTGVRF